MDNDTLEKRRAAFPAFLHEKMQVLTAFFTDINAPETAFVLLHARKYIDHLDTFMKNQDVSPESRSWILTRIGYFVGEYFVQEFSGCWYLNENSQSKNYLKYVVGKFAGYNDQISIDPFLIANEYIDTDKPRSIRPLLEEASDALLKLK